MDNLNNRETNSHVYFYTNYLSNFHKCNIVEPSTGILFKSAQSLIVYLMAKYHGDKDTMQLAIDTVDSSKLNSTPKNIEWIASGAAYRAMRYANILKFSQNEQIKLSLLGTANKSIVYASNDIVLGVGLTANNDKILFENNWVGSNVLGKCLVEVRTILRQN